MAKLHALTGKSRVQTRILIKGRWLTVKTARTLAGHIVQAEAQDALKQSVERLRALLE